MNKNVTLEMKLVTKEFLKNNNLVEELIESELFKKEQEDYIEMKYSDFSEEKQYQLNECKILKSIDFNENSQGKWVEEFGYCNDEILTNKKDNEYWDNNIDFNYTCRMGSLSFEVKILNNIRLTKKEIKFFNELEKELRELYNWYRDYESNIYDYINSDEFLKDFIENTDLYYNKKIGFIKID